MFLEFQLPINISLLVLSIFFPIVMVIPVLTSVQILLINIIMDTLNSLSFGGEPPKEEYMREAPIRKGAGLFIRGSKQRIALSTVSFLVLYAILIFSPIKNLFSTELEANTARFALMCFASVVNGLNIRTEHFNLFDGIGKNNLFYLIGLFIALDTFPAQWRSLLAMPALAGRRCPCEQIHRIPSFPFRRYYRRCFPEGNGIGI